MRPILFCSFIILCTLTTVAPGRASEIAPAPNGIVMPDDYRNWRLIAPSLRSDKNHIRAILGNDIAVQAARAGKVRPWPDGAIFAKVAWKTRTDPHWPTATVPGEFVQAEFMVKNTKKYAATGGWGFARWVGAEYKPYGKDAGFTQECFGCHTPVKDRDYVFTTPAGFP